MATKRSANTAGVDKAKRKRSSLILEVKLDILKRKQQEEGTSAIGRNLGVAQSRVWTVLKNHEAMKKAAENAMDLQSKLLTKH
ncbi:CENPB DNA-binding domain-containing protein 1 [Portunus trituberculatus]|uniref:CENPB DNA-binding domain-containing protein 1 n=1 Tax=Portunus trituberculatus TaxID=210409 RepID=A0A5B7K406_PORTR|nr:CENPB DNA-binding domain-containing protein 1 [Portunus trituberculatus]